LGQELGIASDEVIVTLFLDSVNLILEPDGGSFAQDQFVEIAHIHGLVVPVTGWDGTSVEMTSIQ
jgi:hypothetical protein